MAANPRRHRQIGALPRLRALGTVGLAAGTFDVGWKIGIGINAKLLKIGVPEAADATQNH